MSASLVAGPALTRTAPRASSPATPMAASTWDGATLPDEQAEPEETATPSRSKAITRVSALAPGIATSVVLGDGRPFVGVLITLDAEAFGLWKERNGKPAEATIASLRDDPGLVAAVQAAVDDANLAVSRPESIRKFRILDVDFTQEAGQLSVKLGIRRSVLLKDFATDIDALYS